MFIDKWHSSLSYVVVDDDDDDDDEEEEEEEQEDDGNDDDDDDNVRESFVKCMFVCRSLRFYSFFQPATIDFLKTHRELRTQVCQCSGRGAWNKSGTTIGRETPK